ncbi:MAG: hypothetical protein LBU13_07350, partial [Synergistaceae bacterium]|nr:hypothetical protein [Synergistaceae bacterium]
LTSSPLRVDAPTLRKEEKRKRAKNYGFRLSVGYFTSGTSRTTAYIQFSRYNAAGFYPMSTKLF